MKPVIIFFFLVLAGCNFPKDPEESLEKATRDSLKVGVVNNLPYTYFDNGEASGTEIEFLKEFARSNKINISFIEGSESVLVDKLKNYRLHIVAGGFDKKTIWKKHAGTSATYDSKHLFLIPKGENKLLQQLETYIYQNTKK
ncbi:transporter substrate-binding domain-containing protein [Christiangramia sp.]|uniref:transporter substrate-binding domain-containing protein n=1 Tax=Christiangramia sp. TaxID=1931228 RepID=UPI00260B4E07|nr:transporter substrate-binding domain-containing protein [Christiangramia sp.]